MKILVIGATGMLGMPVARQLQADGHQVRVFSRNPEKARAKFGPAFELAVGDVEDPRALEAALEGCQGVHLNLDGGADPDLERRGGENVARAAAKANVQMLTYLSGASVTEENCWYAGTQAKFQAEAAIRTSGVPYAIFKATFFMETLPRFVRDGRASVIGAQPNPWRWVAAEDYARMVSKAYTLPGLRHDFYVYGPQAFTTQEALRRYCAIVHPRAKVGALPLWVAGLIAAMPGGEALRAALPFFRYTEKATETGSAEEANALLGAPTTTLEEWSKNLLTQSKRAAVGT